MGVTHPDAAPARYVFKIAVRIEPDRQGVALDPNQFETTMTRTAEPPGEEGWLFFRDNLWRGELGDEAHFRTLAEDALGVPVERASFRELQTTAAYLDDLKSAVADDLGLFNADDVSEVLKKYLGSSIRVESGDGD